MERKEYYFVSVISLFVVILKTMFGVLQNMQIWNE